MSLKSHEALSSSEQQIDLPTEAAVKQNVGALLSSLAEEVEANYNGSEYLGLYMTSTNQETGLSRGFLLVTDRSFVDNNNAAYQQFQGELPYFYCSKQLTCILIEELSPDNLNVKELQWDGRGKGQLCRLSEEGLSGISVLDAIGGNRGLIGRNALAASFGVYARDFVLSEGNASPEMINEFFDEITVPGVLDQMKSFDF